MIFARVHGGSSPAIVLLHGFGAFSGVWDAIAADLGTQHRVIAYDLPGHGQSLDWPETPSPKSAARAVLADLETRGVEKAHFVGHSMGGAIATLAALSSPERVASLMLLAPGGFGEEINAPLLRRYGAATSAEELRNCLVAMSTPDFSPPPEAVDALAAMRAQAGQKEMLAKIADAIARDGRQGVIPQDWLATLSIPVTVVWGTEDPMLPFSQTSNLPPFFKLHPVPAAGHMLVEERPGLVADLIRQAIGPA
ncbi:pimeloyl-ACP methyl ester carboxylesterase [Mesorhizobium soli]|uniref:alpha/beta fold hydrolase n=1 Tax=Pseudaminobacter soli (ex Li et al. 2025) TaxID=1295366 RepID=UPI002473CEBD|nr:alpha/beta fold hydrolase [Mesorhizobium soli]MDH6234900.1 pimeloyl-ACP methyl ester carboxylesterase [Mesorhizobium soli]